MTDTTPADDLIAELRDFAIACEEDANDTSRVSYSRDADAGMAKRLRRAADALEQARAASQPEQTVSMAGEPFGDPHPCDVPEPARTESQFVRDFKEWLGEQEPHVRSAGEELLASQPAQEPCQPIWEELAAIGNSAPPGTWVPAQEPPIVTGQQIRGIAEPAQEPVGMPCLIVSANFETDTVTLQMENEAYTVAAGRHWLYTSPPADTARQDRIMELADEYAVASNSLAHELHVAALRRKSEARAALEAEVRKV